MLTRIISLAALAAVAGTQLMPSAAEAGSRGRFCFPFGFLCHDTPPRDFYADEYGDEDGYYQPGYEGEEPVYIAPKKKKTARAAPAPKPTVKKSVALAKKKAVTSTEKKTASAATGVSCDKAEKIVSGYGFAGVKPMTCTGQVFSFNATRSGNAYIIKLSSANGELTEVNKVQ